MIVFVTLVCFIDRKKQNEGYPRNLNFSEEIKNYLICTLFLFKQHFLREKLIYKYYNLVRKCIFDRFNQLKPQMPLN